MRIRGQIGEWPVDLTLELDDAEWARLAGGLVAGPTVASERPEVPAGQGDRLLETAQQLLRSAGEMTGPDLLARLQALTGSPEAGKRLLVRLRHSDQVRVESGADAPLYRWQS